MNSSKLCDGGAVIIFSSPRCMMAFYVDSLGRRPVSRRALNEYNVDAAFELVKYANMGKLNHGGIDGSKDIVAE